MRIKVVNKKWFSLKVIQILFMGVLLYIMSIVWFVYLREYAGCSRPDSAEMWIVKDVCYEWISESDLWEQQRAEQEMMCR